MAFFKVGPKSEFFFYKGFFFEDDLGCCIVIPKIRSPGFTSEYFYFFFPGFQVKDTSEVRDVWLLLKRSRLLSLSIP
jgi:hypothetical protein